MDTTMKTKIWLSSPHMGGDEMKYVQLAFDENWIAPLGPNVNGFENDIEEFLGEGVHVAAVSSGTAALHLALILLGVEPGDEVLCQSMTFSASANCIMYVGAKPVFIDSEKDTWNICPETLERAILDRIQKGKKPKAIIAICIYGMPYKTEEIAAISQKYDIPVIEDSAEALGSEYKGQKMGTFGDISILSFNGNKIITTSGGGALIVKDPAFKKKAIYLSTQAKDDSPYYEHTTLGYNYRMSNVCAGIGRGQMEVLEQRILQRRDLNHFYQGIFEKIEGVSVFKEPDDKFYSNHWLTTIEINPEIWGEQKMLKVWKQMREENIETRPLWKPMHLQPVFKNNIMYSSGVSEYLFNNGLCLPSGSNMTNEEKERVAVALKHCFVL